MSINKRMLEDMDYGILNAELDLELRKQSLLDAMDDPEFRDFLNKQIKELEAGMNMLKKKRGLLTQRTKS